MSNYHIKTFEEYFHIYRKSVREPENFWEEVAEEHFVWRKRWDNVLRWDFSKPEIAWFEGAQLNITENCLDRHLRTRGIKPLFFLNLIILMNLRSTLHTLNYMNGYARWPMY